MLTRSQTRAIRNATQPVSLLESLPDDTLELIKRKLPTNTYLLADFENIKRGKVCLRLATHPTTNEVHMMGTIYMTLHGLEAGYMFESIRDHFDLSLNSSLLLIEGSNNRTFFLFETLVQVETPFEESQLYQNEVLPVYEQQARNALEVFFDEHIGKPFTNKHSLKHEDKKNMQVRLVCTPSVTKYDNRSSTSTFEFEAGTYMQTQGNLAAVSSKLRRLTAESTERIPLRVPEKYKPLLSTFATVNRV